MKKDLQDDKPNIKIISTFQKKMKNGKIQEKWPKPSIQRSPCHLDVQKMKTKAKMRTLTVFGTVSYPISCLKTPNHLGKTVHYLTLAG